MKNLKKIVALTLVAVMTATAFVGCGKSGGENKGGNSSKDLKIALRMISGKAEQTAQNTLRFVRS